MTATDLLATLKARGVHLEAIGDRLRWRPREALTAQEREILVQHKADLLSLLRMPWDQVEADALVARVQDRRHQFFGKAGWPRDSDTRRPLFGLADRIDESWRDRDLRRLRQAVAAFLAAVDGLAVQRVDRRDASAAAPAAASYSPELAELADWFRQARAAGRLPAEPFDLGRGRRVTDPGRFYAALELDLAAGPRSARARLGGLVDALARLRQASECAKG
jgi:hypothetical protein